MLPHYTIVPVEGSFTAYKKAVCGAILVVEIPANSRRTSALVGRKCRASALRVLRAESADGTPCAGTTYHSKHDNTFTYIVGQVAECADYDDDIRVECTRGLHFFVTRAEAVEY